MSPAAVLIGLRVNPYVRKAYWNKINMFYVGDELMELSLVECGQTKISGNLQEFLFLL